MACSRLSSRHQPATFRQALSNVWLLLSHWSVAGIRPLREISLEGSKGPRTGYCAIPIFAGMLVNVWLRS